MDPWEISQGVVPPAGQIGGTASSPTILGLRETSGPTLLTIGAVASGQVLERVGSTLVGLTPSTYTPPGSVASGEWITQPFTSATVLSYNVDDIYAIPFDLPYAVTVKTIGIGQQAASSAGGLWRLGLYADTNGAPGALTTDFGTVAADGANATKSIVIAATYGPGRIWLALAARVAAGVPRSTINYYSPPVRRASADSLNTSNAPNMGYFVNNAGGTVMPNPFAASSLSNNLPQIWLQVN